MTLVERTVIPLCQLHGYTIASGDPDPRGWAAETSDGQALGRVTDLLVNIEDIKVHYLEIAVDRGMTPGLEQEHHILVPAAPVPIGPRERRERRITIPRPAFLAARSAGTAGATPHRISPDGRERRASGEDGHGRRVAEGNHG